ncbi:MAG: acyl-CoA thioesterase [Actinobacteria bacterium]|nr:acyl-CoA thioesterase [Actinomycetota bacterium]
MYIYKTKIRLFHTDAAGLIFYSNLFNLAYECYEEFLEKTDFSISKIINEGKFLIPVVHTEADYIKPIRLEDKIEIQLKPDNIGKSSYKLNYDFLNESGKKAANVKTVHVMISAKDYKPVRIPEKFLIILKALNL